MKSASTDLATTIKESHGIRSSIRLLAEWNQNRYATIKSVTNDDRADVYPEFPISSIVEPHRPQKSGIVRMMTDEDILNTGFESKAPRARTYAVSADDPYKYWISEPSKSVGEADFTYRFPNPVQPTVIYEQPVWANKIVIGLENTFVNVEHSEVQIWDGTLDEDDEPVWKPIATDPTVDINGQITLYRHAPIGQGDIIEDYIENWLETADYTHPMNLSGVRFIVEAVDEPSTHVGVIEVSARLESDLTDFVISWDLDEEISDRSFIAPLGVASSNSASVTLSNVDGRFSNDNPASLYVGIIDKGVRFIMDVGIETAGGTEWTRMFTMVTQNWSGQRTEEVQAELSDDSEFMKTITPPKIFLENHSVGAVIWRLCDMMGFSQHNYMEHASDTSQRIPYFWTDGDRTLWEVFSDLAEGTQTAVYFDAYGALQIRTRNYAFDKNRTPNWNLDAVKVGSKLPDIISYEQTEEFEANAVDVVYNPTRVSNFNNGQPQMEVVWEPEDTVTLRATPLATPMTATDMQFYISSEDAKFWPYEGLVTIDGEEIHYKGKVYRWWTSATATSSKVIFTQEEKDTLDKESHDDYAWRNTFTGKLIVVQRGSNAMAHTNSIGSGGIQWDTATLWDGVAGARWGIQPVTGGWKDSIFEFSTNQTFNWYHNQVLRVNNRSLIGRKKAQYGARLRFKSGVGPASMGEGGIFFNADSSYAGYYVSLYPTQAIDEGWGRDKREREVTLWSRWNENGQHYQGTHGYSAEIEILRDKWYDLDVIVADEGAHDRVSVYVDGILRVEWNLVDKWRMQGGYHGLQIGTHCQVDYEYYYALEGDTPSPDESSVFDHVRGGFVSNADRLATYSTVKSSFNSYVRWHTHTWNPAAQQRLVMQTDGHLVMYTQGQGVVWKTNTNSIANVNSRLVLQDDGNLVIYRPTNVPVWNIGVDPRSTGAVGDPNAPGTQHTLGAGQTLYPGQYLVSPNGRYRAHMQGDGNFVIYGSTFTVNAFDDFGSWVHEVREYDVTFEKAPVTHSKLYFSNDTQAVCSYYDPTPFGAKFSITNAYRWNVILKGEDKQTFGADNSVEQKMFVYGRRVFQEDEQTVTVKNDAAIRRRGESKTEFKNDFIQTKAMAQGIADWVVGHWSGGVDEASVEIFGNPLFELGDVVTVNFPAKNLDPDDYRYFVAGINHSYEEGLETTLILRRLKI